MHHAWNSSWERDGMGFNAMFTGIGEGQGLDASTGNTCLQGKTHSASMFEIHYVT
jgi:hypothetical protein